MAYSLLILLLALTFTQQEFTGREERAENQNWVRRSVYRAKVPDGWVRIDPHGPLSDTTKANVTFMIENQVKVAIHSFPTERLEQRIPPEAQVERWKSQCKGVETKISRVTRGGFDGLLFQAQGVIAWSLQLDMGHYQTLAFLATTPREEEHFKQMRADYTIKATGPQELIDKHREALFLFANSFELIQEIPKRL